MDKFVQKVNEIENTLLIKEAVSDFTGNLYKLLIPQAVQNFTLKNKEEYDPKNVYYLDHGSKSLDALKIKMDVLSNRLKLVKVLKMLEDEYIEPIKDALSTYNKKKITDDYRNLRNKLAFIKDIESRISIPFEEDGSFKTTLIISEDYNDKTPIRTAKGTMRRRGYATQDKMDKDKANITNRMSQLGFEFGKTTLPLLIYSSFNTAINIQRMNYVRLSEILSGELRARKKYSAVFDITSMSINEGNTHKTLMNFFNEEKIIKKANKQINIRYISEEEAKQLEKADAEGGLAGKLGTGLGNIIKTNVKAGMSGGVTANL